MSKKLNELKKELEDYRLSANKCKTETELQSLKGNKEGEIKALAEYKKYQKLIENIESEIEDIEGTSQNPLAMNDMLKSILFTSGGIIVFLILLKILNFISLIIRLGVIFIVGILIYFIIKKFFFKD
jgi:Flp pilus assembly protein TadB